MEHIRTWKQDDFRLELWDTYETNSLGKTFLRYEFYHIDTLVFSGADFCCSPMHAIDSDNSVFALLSFLSLRPGDTDAEYFDDYTPLQIEWRDAYAEELSFLVFEHEETNAN